VALPRWRAPEGDRETEARLRGLGIGGGNATLTRASAASRTHPVCFREGCPPRGRERWARGAPTPVSFAGLTLCTLNLRVGCTSLPAGGLHSGGAARLPEMSRGLEGLGDQLRWVALARRSLQESESQPGKRRPGQLESSIFAGSKTGVHTDMRIDAAPVHENMHMRLLLERHSTCHHV